MRKTVLTLLVAGLYGCITPQPYAPVELPQTTAEQSNYQATSTYDDVLSFIMQIDALSPEIHLTSFGETVEGRSLPLVVWGADGPTPGDAKAGEKTRVLVFANIHAGEVCGKEAIQMLVRDLAQGEHADWSDSVVLLLAPIYNADGNEQFDPRNRPMQNGPEEGMGQRPNMQGYDLNRDFMKLAAPESRSMVWLLNEYDPHVVVDLHTTNGTRHAYHLTYAPPLNPNTPVSIDAELRNGLLPIVSQRIENSDGWYLYHYGNVPGAFGEPPAAPRAWYSFDARPRFSTNYTGIRNRLGILSEAYSYASFEERVKVTQRFVEEVISYVAGHGSEINQLTREADEHSIVGQELSLRATLKSEPAPVDILMGGVDSLYHSQTGELILARTDEVIPEEMGAYISFEAAETERAPSAYLVPESMTEVIELLDLHGIEYYHARQPTPIEIFTIESLEVAEQEFQGRHMQSIEGYYATLDDAASTSVVVVSVDQPLGRLAFILLEPRSDDGVVSWAIVPPEMLTNGRDYPIRRIHGSLPPR